MFPEKRERERERERKRERERESASKGLRAQEREPFGAFPLHGTARYGTVRFTFGGFSTGYCTWYLILF